MKMHVVIWRGICLKKVLLPMKSHKTLVLL